MKHHEKQTTMKKTIKANQNHENSTKNNKKPYRPTENNENL